MVREDILGGLNSAIARGQSLKQAMMSFYNAGYSKAEIEEAAQALKSGMSYSQVQPQQQASVQTQQPILQTQNQNLQQTAQKVSAYGSPPVQQQFQIPQQQNQQKTFQPTQSVSSYGQPQKPKGKAAIFILVGLLLLLVGALVTVFFFKEEIINFFST